MQKQDLFSTGEVRGITGLSTQSIQLYVRTFPEIFSAQARQPHRGRRYTWREVKAIQLIHHLRTAERQDKDTIRAALAGEWESRHAQMYEVQDLAAFMAEARKFIKTMNEKERSWTYAAAGAKPYAQNYLEITRIVRELNSQYPQLWNNQVRYSVRISDLEEKVKSLEAQLQKRRGWFG